jgi:ABC-type uncharacterized transport system auxiliary subunit
MKKKTCLPALMLATILLTACSGVMDSAQPAKQYYMLVPWSGATGAANPSAGAELWMNLGAVPGLDTDRVLALSNDARLNHYANARWPDHLPEVLTSVIRRSLISSGLFTAVEEGSKARGEGWLLKLEVQQFYGIQNAPGSTSSVMVEIRGTIECNDLRGSFTLTDSNTVGEERLSAVVAAHQQGLNEATRQLMDEIRATCM